MICVVFTIHQTSPTQDSRLTGGGSPNLVDLVQWKMGAAKRSIYFTYDCTHLLYEQLIHTGSVLLLLLHSSVLGSPLYKDTANGSRQAQNSFIYTFPREFNFHQWSLPLLASAS
jgi:hypothetical protein